VVCGLSGEQKLMRMQLKDSKQKSVVALVLARGGIEEFPEQGNLKYKALLPFLGQPLIAYIVDALADSTVENIFVLQERDACLESTLRFHPKVNFINHDGPSASVAEGLVFGLERILKYYGGQTDQFIAIVPCDIPKVRSSEIKVLIEQLQKMDSDLVFTSIRLGALGGLAQRLTIYSPELREKTASQNINFISGSRLKLDGQNHLLVLDKEDRVITGIDLVLDSIRKHRKSAFLWPRLIYQFYGSRLIKNGHYLLLFEALTRLITGRLSMASVRKVYDAAVKIRVDVIISSYPSFSFDVDTPEDLAKLESTFYS
jgi:molybdopterin-guanine dinucleotide biosynthesis protein A